MKRLYENKKLLQSKGNTQDNKKQKMISKIKITTPIREILLNNLEIAAMVGQNIFPIIAPDNTNGDFIIYQRNGFSKKSTKMGVYKQVTAVYINAISDNYDRSQDLADLIYNCLEGTFSNPNMQITLIDSKENFENGKYMQILLFEVE